ncbi:MAG: hypothetical protein A3H28_09160 [Acidobacteria bacterium RIFCSPLOWO2_02_FULL_61_28]|nr:MAG: hypothetical protein A3H28_09160 [Acidobacteria bacterium RIFCSPLOWO2_02_FULL_61_28]
MRGTVRLAAILALVLFPNLVSAQTATPAIIPGGILNAAGVASEPSNAAAPGGLVTIFGRNLANTTATGSGVPLPRELNGTAVLVGNVFAPLLFISPTQINAQIPLEVLPGSFVNVVVWVSGRPSAPEPLRVEIAAPGIFTVSGNGTGLAVVLHAADSSAVNASSPAAPGEEVLIVCTGLGLTVSSATVPALISGAAGSGQPTLLVPSVTIGRTAAGVVSTRATGGVGQYVIRAAVPTVSPGELPIVVFIGDRATQAPVSIPVGTPFTQPGGGTGGTGGGTQPVIFTGGIINAASLAPSPSNRAAPGGLISIFGTNLATSTTETSTAPLPRALSGTSVTIANIAAPLLLVSPTQINAQVPLEIAPGTAVEVVVVVDGRASTPEPLLVVPAAPGIFTTSGSGSGPGRILHANGGLISSAAPAIPGEEVTIVATGLGATLATGSLPALKTGEAGAGQLTLLTPTVAFSGKDARVTFSGAAPDSVGQYLVRVIVPDVAAGDQSVTMTAAGSTSRAILVRIGYLFPQPPAFLQARMAGSFTATFSLKIKSPDPSQANLEIEEVASFSKTVASPGCVIDIAGTSGPTYTGLVHCQDYSDPNNLVAIIMGLKDGQFANNKLVFTTLQDTGINHFFFIGGGVSPSGTLSLTAESAITDGAVSIDLKRPDFGPGDTVIGTVHLTFTIGGTGTIPSQTVVVGGGFSDTINFVRR